MRTAQTGGRRRTAGAFDVRTVIAALFLIYGAVLTVMGVAATGPEDLAKAVDININLWTGIGMLVFAALFVLWSWWRPVVVEEAGESSEQ